MLKVIDNQFNFLGQIDEYNSLIATRSFYSIGDFELHLNFTKEYSTILVEENIIFISPEKPYIILYKEINSKENKMIIKGQELKHYISRRITKPPDNQAYHRIHDFTEKIMKEYVTANCDIPNLQVAPNLNRGIKQVFQTRFKQVDLELEKLGISSHLGWTIRLDLANKKFIFDVNESVDRTAGQDINSRCIFAAGFDNVADQKLAQSKLGYKSVAYVGGQGEGASRYIEIVGDAYGFERYETFIDARDIEDDDDLKDRGLQKLAEVGKIASFDSDILTNSNLKYEMDYNLGDVVTIQNKDWGVTLDTVITDITEIYEVGGFRLTATFGNSIPTFTEMLKRKLDEPIFEGGSGSGSGLENIDGGKPSSIFGGLEGIDGGGV